MSQERESNSNRSPIEGEVSVLTEQSQEKGNYTKNTEVEQSLAEVACNTESSLDTENISNQFTVSVEPELLLKKESVSNPSLTEDEEVVVIPAAAKNFKNHGRMPDRSQVLQYTPAKRKLVEGLLASKEDLRSFEHDIHEDLKRISPFSVPPQLKDTFRNEIYMVAEVDSSGICANNSKVLYELSKKKVFEKLAAAKSKYHPMTPDLEPPIDKLKSHRALIMLFRQRLSKHTSEMTDRIKELHSNKLTREVYQLAQAGLTVRLHNISQCKDIKCEP